MDKKEHVIKENAREVANKTYQRSDYEQNDQLSKGMAITHEQVSDGYTEGTIDGKIDETNENDTLRSHDGEKIERKGYGKK
ncbi:YozQ family protein [Virgibacillus sp. NKC19-16]|uniref:YozQ family protein n=1 Tax=Virgibacillus salidurans TaxID=2831673 RepID=UPI001F378E41|nr:YozQ family protein [Virgibacillus sp. NKC19-16]UJL46407.1 YozQ family protein [Virgibacillus sp. NKC19-16]